MSSENAPPHLEDLGRHGEKPRDGDGTQAQHTEGLPSRVLPSTPWARYQSDPYNLAVEGESPRAEIGGPESGPRRVSRYHRSDAILHSQPLSGFIPAQPQSYRGRRTPPYGRTSFFFIWTPSIHAPHFRPYVRAAIRHRQPLHREATPETDHGFLLRKRFTGILVSHPFAPSQGSSTSGSDYHIPRPGRYPQYDPSLPPPVLSPPRRHPTWRERLKRHLLVRILHSFLVFLLLRIPKPIYLHLLLRLPLLYFSRVSRLFEDANLSLPDIRRMAVANADQWKGGMLAIPSVWMAWSIILFVTCIMAFTWRTGALADPVDTALSNHTARGLRIGVSAVLAVALVYVFLIVKTFRKYGDVMGQKWNEKHSDFKLHSERRPRPYSHRPIPYLYPSRRMSPMRSTSPPERGRSFTREIPLVQPTPAPSFQRRFVPPANRDLAPFAAVKASWTHPLPTLLAERDILLADWVRFTQDLSVFWDGTVLSSTPPFPIDPDSPIGLRERAAGVIHLWNGEFFFARSTEAVLCKQKPRFGLPSYAVYLLHLSPDTPFGPLPEGMHSVTVIHLIEPADRGPATVQYDVVAAAQTPIRGNFPITAQSESEPAQEPEPGAEHRDPQHLNRARIDHHPMFRMYQAFKSHRQARRSG
ncbi:hypothetical protein C8R43DRAFT_942686 [Mycena crocata]|nr:hypothetical protein C8R43DRAFT_942686 [Mycena crocata]